MGVKECFWSLFHTWQQRPEYFSLCCFNLGPPLSVYSNSIPRRWILQRHEYASLCLVMTGQGWSENIPEIKGVWLNQVHKTHKWKSIFYMFRQSKSYRLHITHVCWSPWTDEVRATIKTHYSAWGLNHQPLNGCAVEVIFCLKFFTNELRPRHLMWWV